MNGHTWLDDLLLEFPACEYFIAYGFPLENGQCAVLHNIAAESFPDDKTLEEYKEEMLEYPEFKFAEIINELIVYVYNRAGELVKGPIVPKQVLN